MNEQETREYLRHLVDGIGIITAKTLLEPRFSEEELERLKVIAIGCVRIKNDMDERMRKLRERL